MILLKQSAANSRMVEIRGPLMASHRFEPQMKIELFLKDFTRMLDEGRRIGGSRGRATPASGRTSHDSAPGHRHR